jgi:hypothetical protein
MPPLPRTRHAVGDMKTVFDEVNKYRALHATNALAWDPALASAAAAWINKCSLHVAAWTRRPRMATSAPTCRPSTRKAL